MSVRGHYCAWNHLSVGKVAWLTCDDEGVLGAWHLQTQLCGQVLWVTQVLHLQIQAAIHADHARVQLVLVILQRRHFIIYNSEKQWSV